jgi:hypothetical protein
LRALLSVTTLGSGAFFFSAGGGSVAIAGEEVGLERKNGGGAFFSPATTTAPVTYQSLEHEALRGVTRPPLVLSAPGYRKG